MNIIVIPDAAMIVIPLIEKNGHTYLSPSNFSRYNNTSIYDGNFEYEKVFSSYMSSEVPSGVRGRLFLLSKIIEDADAAIIIGKRPKNYDRIYNALNDLILFGGNSCNNAHSLAVKMVQDLDIPILKLAYPSTKSDIMDLIDKTNNFLINLHNIDGTVNDDNLTPDLHVKKKKCSVSTVERALNNLI